jgi:biopolymer transport protein TolR
MRSDRFRAPVAEINVTPLVDVMLVLLTVFMVTAPMMQQGIDVTLPKAVSSKIFGDTEPVITLTKEHVTYFNGAVVSGKELKKKLAGLKSGTPVTIRSDRNARVNKLVELWDLCRDAGFPQVRITTLSE